jgi:hypothetical protein
VRVDRLRERADFLGRQEQLRITKSGAWLPITNGWPEINALCAFAPPHAASAAANRASSALLARLSPRKKGLPGPPRRRPVITGSPMQDLPGVNVDHVETEALPDSRPRRCRGDQISVRRPG